MYNAEVLSDIRLHKHDIESVVPGISTGDLSAMLDRLVRDLLPDGADKLIHYHGEKHTRFKSLEFMRGRLEDIESKQ